MGLRSLSPILVCSLAIPALALGDGPPAAPLQVSAQTVAESDVSYRKDVLPFLTKHCFACHGNGKSKADFSFDKFTDDQSIAADLKAWDNVVHMLKGREMPPMDRPQPEPAEVDVVLKAIGAVRDRIDRNAKPNAGRVTMRRLNKTEYDNTIRDLVGIDFKPAEDFPSDDVGYGFDNIGDVLSISPLLVEKYLAAAESILEQAIVIADRALPSNRRFDTIRTKSTDSTDELGKLISFEEGGYLIRCRVAAERVGAEPVRATLLVAGKAVKDFQITGTLDAPQTIECRVPMPPETVRIGIMLANPSPPSDIVAPRRVLHLREIEVEGPFDAPPPQYPESHRRLMAHREGATPREAAHEIVTRFASRAFRRPVKPEEVERCLALYDALEKKGKRFELCVRAALYRVLVSPHFLFRVELDPAGAEPGATYAVSEYELASRLSYFLWNSMPDETLLALAEAGRLRENLAAQVQRMVEDPRSASFLQNFAEQWLTLRKLDLASPDPTMFPTFDGKLRQAMILESQLFFEAVVREDKSILDLLISNFTFVNGPLARLYGISDVKGSQFVRVAAPPHRGGILTQASILALTSNATRTSPVKRGKFVLEQILNTPPPPPPDDVPALEDQKELKGTLRQVMEQHRANATCASCHQRMDPIGFAFENFDSIGAWRDRDAGAAIDPSGVLPDGRSFDGPEGLKGILREQKELFVRCVAEKLLTYALGRGLEYYDRRPVDKIMDALKENDYRFSTLLIQIVTSEPFQKRTVPGESR